MQMGDLFAIANFLVTSTIKVMLLFWFVYLKLMLYKLPKQQKKACLCVHDGTSRMFSVLVDSEIYKQLQSLEAAWHALQVRMLQISTKTTAAGLP